MSNESELGREYRDKITGFRGICTGRVQYISGCDQALLAPKVGKDGALKDSQWFDVQRLEPVSRIPRDVIKLENSATPGPDKPAPKR